MHKKGNIMLRLTSLVLKNHSLCLSQTKWQNPLCDNQRERHPPNYNRKSVAIACDVSREPANVKAAVLASLEKAQWSDAMDLEKEMESLETNDPLDLVELPSDRAVVSSKCKVFKLKN